MLRGWTKIFAFTSLIFLLLLHRFRNRIKYLVHIWLSNIHLHQNFEVISDKVEANEDFVKTIFRICRLAEEKKNGLGVIQRFGLRKRSILVLTNPKHVDIVLKSSMTHGMGLLQEATQNFVGKKCLFALEGDDWKTQRGLMTQILHSERVNSTFAIAMETVSFRMVTRLGERIRENPIVDVHAMFCRMHVSTIGKGFFGDDFRFFHQELYPSSGTSLREDVTQPNSAREEILHAFEYLLKELPTLAQDMKNLHVSFDEFKANDPEWCLLSQHARSACRSAVRKRLSARASSTSASKQPRDALEELIDFYSSFDENEVVESVTDNIVQMIFAGFNTVVVGLSFALFYLAQNPIWWEEVRAEVDQLFENHDFSRKGQPVDTVKLVLLEAILLETLRLVPPSAFTGRILQKDIALEDNLILPAGTDVFLPIIYLAHQERSWGTDATSFNPRRWLRKDFKIPPGAFLAFSGGPRSCIGEEFAKKESLTVLALLIHFFNFELVPGARQIPKWTGYGIRPFDSSFGKISMNLKVTRRKPMKSYTMQRRQQKN